MLKFLGSGGAFNTARGNTSGYFILRNELFLFDCGEDVFHKIRSYELLEGVNRVNIFITHLHGDHAGSLGSFISYLFFNVFHEDMSNICVYYPNEVIEHYLKLQGVPRAWYNHFSNRWDELYIPGFKKQPEYAFHEVAHTSDLDYNGETTTFSIEFLWQDELSFYYSGDSSQFAVENINLYDYVYHEVTMHKDSGVHLSYERLLEATKEYTEEEKGKIYLMHLDADFDFEQAERDGFHVVENQIIEQKKECAI